MRRAPKGTRGSYLDVANTDLRLLFVDYLHFQGLLRPLGHVLEDGVQIDDALSEPVVLSRLVRVLRRSGGMRDGRLDIRNGVIGSSLVAFADRHHPLRAEFAYESQLMETRTHYIKRINALSDVRGLAREADLIAGFLRFVGVSHRPKGVREWVLRRRRGSARPPWFS